MKSFIKNKYMIIMGLISLLYFIILIKYYLIDFYVPDYWLYNKFSRQNLPSKDGFSSLFIFITGLTTFMPKFMTILSLVLLSISIFIFGIFYNNISKTKNIYPILFMISIGCWYYFYGKIYYDFPFSVFTYSLSLYFLGRLLQKRRVYSNHNKEWYIFILLQGLTLSWKPYNIFMIFGLSLLLFCNKETRDVIKEKMKKFYLIIAFFIIGYLIGNYKLIIMSIETIKGIRAYKAHYNFSDFMLWKNRIIWDHVNDLPFNLSVINILSLIIVCIIIPILIKKYQYIVVALINFIFFYIFITYFSPGYAWHGFAMGIFIITLVFFYAKYLDNNKIASFLFKIAIIIQVVVLVGFYIPKQNYWHEQTIKSEELVILKADKIFNDIEELTKNISKQYGISIDYAVKRYRPTQNAPIKYNKLTLNNHIILVQNVSYYNHLQYANIKRYNRLQNQGTNKEKEYIVYVIPNYFLTMGDVYRNIINDRKNVKIINEKYGDGYTISLYEKNNLAK